MKTIKDVDVRGKRVLVRVDFNVPLDPRTGDILNDYRIRASVPTIRYLMDNRAKVILCSHLGRPGGKVLEELRMAPVARRLAQIMGWSVQFSPECVGTIAEETVSQMTEGDVLMLENLRFYPGEEANDPGFARQLANLADIFVNDAFSAAHRAHASTVGITEYLPSVAGLLLKREVDSLSSLIKSPLRPFTVVIGGAKVADKIAVLDRLMRNVNYMLVGGAMAATFLKARGHSVGLSLVEEDRLQALAEIDRRGRGRGVRVVLPVDVVVADQAGKHSSTVPVGSIPADMRIVDIGPQTLLSFRPPLEESCTVFWNGPMGIYETPDFAHGTFEIARIMSRLKATTIIGGGSTADAVIDLKLAPAMSLVSTGGGATLAFLGGEKLPGLEALERAPVLK